MSLRFDILHDGYHFYNDEGYYLKSEQVKELLEELKEVYHEDSELIIEIMKRLDLKR